MTLKKVVVTGDEFFIKRHYFIFKAMSQHLEHLQFLPYGDLKQATVAEILSTAIYKIFYKFSPQPADKFFYKNPKAFIKKSLQTEQKILQLNYQPDFVIHLFGTYSPFWQKFDIPYAMYLDYTMSLVEKSWLPWAPFTSREEWNAWINCERRAYQQAHHLLSMSHVVKQSLIEDYGIKPEKIAVVGSAANFQEIYQGDKKFGSKQILFNGSDFERKGGDLVLAAFEKVKQEIPDTRLVVIGKKLGLQGDGIDNPGKISSRSELRNLLLKTDLVVAPAYCDPFPVFLMEAMNYGVPCIVSEQDGMPEIVEHESDGIVINQPTAALLAERIINLVNNPAKLKVMSQKAQDKARIQFNGDRVAQNILQTLSS